VYILNYTPTALGVHSWREITLGGMRTKKAEYRWVRPLIEEYLGITLGPLIRAVHAVCTRVHPAECIADVTVPRSECKHGAWCWAMTAFSIPRNSFFANNFLSSHYKREPAPLDHFVKQDMKRMRCRESSQWLLYVPPTSTKTANSVVWVRELTIPTERPPLVDEVSANFCG
jgi:hypothetical protein